MGSKLPTIELYEKKFHIFFDGLIGTETLSTLESILNYKNETLTLLNQTIEFHKHPIEPLSTEFFMLNCLPHIEDNKLGDQIKTDHLNEFEKIKLIKTINKHKQIIHKENEKLSAAIKIKHHIKITTDKPIYTKSYRYPHAHKKIV